MLQKKRIIGIAVISCAVVLLTFFSVQIAFAQFDGFNMPAQPDGTPENFDSAILNATNWILGFVGALSVLALIWGGINYATSAGSEEQAKTGKQTIKYALLGLVIAGIAWALVNVIVTTIL